MSAPGTTAVESTGPARPAAKRRRAPIGPLEYSRRLWLQLSVLAALVFLYVPIVTLVMFSFNDSRRNIVWKGFTLKYYEKALKNNDLIEAFANSLTIAFVSTVVSVILGALVAVLLWRFRFPFKAPYEGAMALPIVIPEICLGVAMLVFFARIGWPADLIWPFNLGSIIIAHISFSFPFVAMVVRARLVNFNREQEEAAKDLGASEWETFRDILVPFMKPGLVAGGLLAFTLSLDDFVITFFTSGPDTVTFPIKVYSMVRFSVTPEVNAASTVLIVITLALTAVAMWLQTRSSKKDAQEGLRPMETGQPIISIRNVTKQFGGAVTAVDNVDLEIKAGEFFALLGPSGCGKTTLLRMIAGFEIPTEGEVLIDGQDMSHVPPNKRPINMVFQSYAVFPHMSVFDNVAYGLKVTGVPRDEIKERVEESLGLVKLEGYGSRQPDQLSGGQRQRVALARALVKRPKVLLLDEPLSALDAKLREAMQLELVRLQHAVGITFIIVTHDQSEALSMANRIAVMEAGKVRQVAEPAALYEYPNCRFVADFIGKMNLFEGRMAGVEGERLLIEVAGMGRLSLPGEAAGAAASGQDVGIAVRPEKVRIERAQPAAPRVALHGKVSEVAYYGETSSIFVTDDSGRSIAVNLQNEARSTTPAVAVGEELWCSWDPDDTLVLTA